MLPYTYVSVAPRAIAPEFDSDPRLMKFFQEAVQWIVNVNRQGRDKIFISASGGWRVPVLPGAKETCMSPYLFTQMMM